MPILMGFEVAEKVRENDKNLNYTTPILALTAAGLFDEIQKSLSAGMNDYLTKPFTPEQLQSVIQKNVGIRVPLLVKGNEKFSFSSLALPECMNHEVLSELYDSDLDYASHMIAVYLKMLPLELEIANRLFSNKKVKEIRSWLHKLAPSVKMMGLNKLYIECKDLELEISNQTAFNKISGPFKMVLKRMEVTKGAVKILKSKLK
jgi:response regulator RpfG family c-di-GMP phosphodiesterase